MGCQKMKPVVHGLEKRYAAQLDVLYFDISDKKYHDARRKLKSDTTPHFILLRANGDRVRDWTGVIPEETLRSAIDRLLAEGFRGDAIVLRLEVAANERRDAQDAEQISRHQRDLEVHAVRALAHGKRLRAV
jgi:thioredoxin-like negative regulator of GroEL